MIYFDSASTSIIKPTQVIETIMNTLAQGCASPKRGGHVYAQQANASINETRKLLAQLFNIRNHHHISFTLNATHASNILIKGFLGQGDHVIISGFEHNSIIRPLEKLVRNNTITYDVIYPDKRGFFTISEAETLIRTNTRLLSCNHASNVTGIISPIKQWGELAKKHNLFLWLMLHKLLVF